MAGLIGTAINGSWFDRSPAPYDRTQESDPVWPPAVDSWPEVVLDEFEVTRSRLESEIAAAKARATAARHRAVERDADVRAVLRAELVASQEFLTEMEHQHDMTVALVREAAQAEVERILAEARHVVAGHPEGAMSSEPAPVNHAE